MAKKEAPLGVKLIAALYSISAGGYVVTALYGAFLSGTFGTIYGIPLLIGGLFLALFMIWVSYNLWKGKSWARGFSIVMGSLAAVGAIMAIWEEFVIAYLIELILAVLIVYYFGFNKKVKTFFTK